MKSKKTTNLVKNRFGVYYYCVVFPESIRKIINKQQARRSLKTKDLFLAQVIAHDFRYISDWICHRIQYHNMKWIEAKEILDKTADELFKKYVDRVHQVGFSFKDKDSLHEIMSSAKTFLFNNYEMYHIDVKPVHTIDGQVVDYEPIYTSRDEYETQLNVKKEVTRLVDSILQKNDIQMSKKNSEYKDFCRQTLEMVYRLDKRKNVYKERILHGETDSLIPDQRECFTGSSKEPSIPLSELIKQFINYKIIVKKQWTEKTAKGNRENLGRISDMFEMVTGTADPNIGILTREHARQVNETIALFPANFKKKYPGQPLKKIIDDSRNGIIPETERIKTPTFNKYAFLISGMFQYALDQEFITDNYFKNLNRPKEKGQKRLPFTNEELTKFFNTDLFMIKNFKPKYAWRYWVPLIMLYTGARLEEICQLQLDDIYDVETILCFHIRERQDPKSGQVLTKVKTEQSNRLIPVHPVLIRLGITSYVYTLKAKSENQLFPALKNQNQKGEYKSYSSDVSKYFNENSMKYKKTSYIHKCGITDQTKVLYCFRHTVESVLLNHPDGINHDDIDKLLGHEIKSIGRKNYGKYNINTLQRIVSKIEYPDVKFPWGNDSTSLSK